MKHKILILIISLIALGGTGAAVAIASSKQLTIYVPEQISTVSVPTEDVQEPSVSETTQDEETTSRIDIEAFTKSQSSYSDASDNQPEASEKSSTVSRNEDSTTQHLTFPDTSSRAVSQSSTASRTTSSIRKTSKPSNGTSSGLTSEPSGGQTSKPSQPKATLLSMYIKPVPTLTEGSSATVTAIVFLSDGSKLTKGITWASSDTNVVSVNKNGKLTAKAEGSATITAAYSGHTSSFNITVTKQSDNKGWNASTHKKVLSTGGYELYEIPEILSYINSCRKQAGAPEAVWYGGEQMIQSTNAWFDNLDETEKEAIRSESPEAFTAEGEFDAAAYVESRQLNTRNALEYCIRTQSTEHGNDYNPSATGLVNGSESDYNPEAWIEHIRQNENDWQSLMQEELTTLYAVCYVNDKGTSFIFTIN